MRWSEYAPDYDGDDRAPQLRVADAVGRPLTYHAVEARQIREFPALVASVSDELGQEYELVVFQSVLRKQLEGYFAKHTEPVEATIVMETSKNGRQYYTLS